jgi:hypothetical protein
LEIVLDLRDHTSVGRYVSMGRAAEAFALIVFVAIAFAAVTLHWANGGELSDARADWLAISAATQGLDPYGDVLDLASIFDVPMNVAAQSESELGPGTWVHPRAPGALILMAPGSVLSAEGYRLAILLASVVVLIWIFARLLPPLIGIPRRLLLLGAPLLIPSYPVFATLEFGAQSAVIAGLVIFAWVRSTQNRLGAAGLAIGIAAALKAWPLLLVFPLWLTGRRRAAAVALATTVSATAAGMLLFGLTPSKVIDAFGAATERWLLFSPNGSATGWAVRAGMPFGMAFFVGMGAAVLLTWVVARRDPSSAFPAAIILALLLSPLSWAHYDVVLFGVVAWLFTRSRWQRNVAVIWLVAAVTGMGLRFFGTPAFTLVGLYTLAGRLLLATAVVIPALKRGIEGKRAGETGLAEAA